MTKTMKPKSPKPKSPHHEWSWDENVLIIDAWHRIQQQPSDVVFYGITAKLADDLGTTPRKIRNAVEAVAGDRKRSEALQILLQQHPNPAGLRDSRVAAAEAKKVRKRRGLV
jgi:hypothetical protein